MEQSNKVQMEPELSERQIICRYIEKIKLFLTERMIEAIARERSMPEKPKEEESPSFRSFVRRITTRRKVVPQQKTERTAESIYADLFHLNIYQAELAQDFVRGRTNGLMTKLGDLEVSHEGIDRFFKTLKSRYQRRSIWKL